jgi:hypothetical protein
MICEAERGPQPEGDVPVEWSSETFRYSPGPRKPSLTGCHGPRPEICSLLLIFTREWQLDST